MYYSKIKSIKSIGLKKVYDISVEDNHNFFLSNGILSHNCYGRTGTGKSVSLLSISQSYHDAYGYKIFDLDGGPRCENLYWTIPSQDKLYWRRFSKIGHLDEEGPKQYKINLLYPYFKSRFPKKLPKKVINGEIVVNSIPFTIPLKQITKDDIAPSIGVLSEASKYVWNELQHKATKKDNSGSLLEICKTIKGATNTPIYKNFITLMHREEFIANNYSDYNLDLIAEYKNQKVISVLCLDFVPKEFQLFVINWICRMTADYLDANKIPKKNLMLIREAARYFRATDDSVLEDRFKIFRTNMADYIRMGRRGNYFCLDCQSSCLEENTKILINKKGNCSSIYNLPKDFYVLSYNFKNKKIQKVKAQKKKIGERMCYKILFSDKSSIIATKEHRFFTLKNKEVFVENLKKGDSLVYFNQKDFIK